ncbi:MAG: hypothetical protein JNM06_10875 [Blastocatellia bacterium]|nr:hypothetical protein [Blastocatellia bacterium]MBN8721932.1 hypothetical protein [Acidobacteriota bacterium]
MRKFFLSALIIALTITTAYSGLNFTGGLNVATSANATLTAPEVLAQVPNSDFVVLFDLNRFLSTKLMDSILSDQNSRAEFEKFEREAVNYGLNLRQIQQIAVGFDMEPSGKDPKFCLVMTGGIDREKILSSIAANLDKVGVDAEQYQGKTIYLVTDKTKKNAKPSDRVAAAFLSPQSVAIGTIEKIKDAVDLQNGKGKSVSANQELSNHINSTNTSAILRFAGAISEKVTNPSTPNKKSQPLTNDDLSSSSKAEDSSPFGNVDKLVQAIRGGYGSLDFVSGVQMDTTLLIRTETEAKQISDALNGLLFLGRSALQQDPKQASFAKALDKVIITGGLKDVRLNIDIPEPLLNELIKTLNSKPSKSSTPKLEQ